MLLATTHPVAQADPNIANDTPAATPSQAAANQTVYLLLHGLNSNVSDWDKLVKNVFNNSCQAIGPVATEIKPGKSKILCIRYNFSKFTDEKHQTWNNGDGLSFQQLGEEVRQAVQRIDSALHPAAIVLVGHSRGGLAARVYAQSLQAPTPFKLGLLTIGTPHLGSPLGRMKHWLDSRNISINDVPESVTVNLGFFHIDVDLNLREQLRFSFSPSSGYLASEYDRNGNLVCGPNHPVSKAICDIREGAANLPAYVSVVGHIYVSGLRLGENILRIGHKPGSGSGLFYLDLMDGEIKVDRLLPNTVGYREMEKYILANIARFDKDGNWTFKGERQYDRKGLSWNGDGIVPLVSQKITQLPGQGSVVSLGLSNIVHADVSLPEDDYNQGETGQSVYILRMLRSMAKRSPGLTVP